MTIKWNEKLIPFNVSYYAIKHFQEETGAKLSDIDGENLKLLEVLVWHAIVAGYKKQNLPVEVTREDVEWILDESLNEVFTMIGTSTQMKGDSKKN